MNSKISLRVNWQYLISVILAAAVGLGGIAWLITAQVYREYAQGLPISGGWNWGSVIAVDLVCLLAFLALLWKMYCDKNTRIGTVELTQPSLLGLKRIAWAEVTDVSIFSGLGYHVRCEGRKIVVTPYAYRNPKAVIATLQARVEAGKRRLTL